MGRIAKILSFIRNPVNDINKTDVKLNPDGGSNINAQHFSSPGDDAFPLNTDFVVTTKVQGEGKEAAIGYADPKNAPKTSSGEKRIYSRDVNGDEIAEIWLKNDGTIEIANQNGSVKINTDGTIEIISPTIIDITAPTINLTGTVVVTGTIAATSIATTGDVVANGKSLETHTHPAGTPPGNTGVPN